MLTVSWLTWQHHCWSFSLQFKLTLSSLPSHKVRFFFINIVDSDNQWNTFLGSQFWYPYAVRLCGQKNREGTEASTMKTVFSLYISLKNNKTYMSNLLLLFFNSRERKSWQKQMFLWKCWLHTCFKKKLGEWERKSWQKQLWNCWPDIINQEKAFSSLSHNWLTSAWVTAAIRSPMSVTAGWDKKRCRFDDACSWLYITCYSQC